MTVWLWPMLARMFAFFVVPMLSTALLREKADGTLRRLVAAPLPRSSLIGGKVLAFLLVVIVQVKILFAIGAGTGHGVTGVVRYGAGHAGRHGIALGRAG